MGLFIAEKGNLCTHTFRYPNLIELYRPTGLCGKYTSLPGKTSTEYIVENLNTETMLFAIYPHPMRIRASAVY